MKAHIIREIKNTTMSTPSRYKFFQTVNTLAIRDQYTDPDPISRPGHKRHGRPVARLIGTIGDQTYRGVWG